jgi:DNA replication protein DnaC
LGDPDCEICHGIGYYRLDVPMWDERFGKSFVCDCRSGEVSAYLQRQRIGSYLEDVRMDAILERGPGSKAMIREAAAFLESPHGFLTIWGSNGNGKSTTLMAIANECLDRGVRSIYLTAADFEDYIKTGFGDADMDTKARLDALVDVPVLCLDEMSAVSWSKYNQTMLGKLIDRRYRMDESKGTVMAMDDKPDSFLHRRILSRIAEWPIVKNMDDDMRPMLKETR